MPKTDKINTNMGSLVCVLSFVLFSIKLKFSNLGVTNIF